MRAQDRKSAHSRHGARDLLVRALYQWQLADHSLDELLEQFTSLPEFGRVDQRYFRELLTAVLGHVDALDELIASKAGRDVGLVDAVGRAVLLLGLEELGSRPDIPTKVVINEAVELAKVYGPPDCFRFVNAVLDGAARATGGRAASIDGR